MITSTLDERIHRSSMSNICRDFVVSQLRAQMSSLGAVLNALEQNGRSDEEYAQESLRQIENRLRQIRKLCVHSA